MSESKKIYFLYSEVMPYTIAVIKALVDNFDCKVTLVHWDSKKLTPYDFDISCVQAIPRSSVDYSKLKKLFTNFQPDLVYVSGRMDKMYLRLAKYANGIGIPTVMGSDKQWHGSLKDRIAKFLSRAIYHRYFSHVWVAGPRQQKYAKEVSFNSDQIIKGVYAADTSLFNRHEIELGDDRINVLFVGRLIEYKGIKELIDVLNTLRGEGVFKGKLLLYGNGPLRNSLPDYGWINYKGFGAQETIFSDLPSVKLFILPSWKEPWGVVIHEMAAAGLPIVCTTACGASDAFVEDGLNGYVVPPKNKELLSNRIKRILSVDNEELVKMSKKSKELAAKYSPSQSAKNLLSILH